jgi:chromosome partitioning protein
MAVIISIAHQKGGVGKSTLAINLSSYFRRNEIDSAVVDADVQGSITSLVQTYGEHNQFEDIKLIPRSEFNNFTELEDREEEVLVIDTPPYLSANLQEIFAISDYVLIPTKAGVFDMFAVEGTLELVEAHPELRVGVVINMTNKSEKFRHEIREHLSAKNVDVFETEIFKRIEFQRSLLTGSIFSGSDWKAKAEITNLGEEVLSKLQSVA